MRREHGYIEKDNGDMWESENAAGLCCTCKHRKTCTFPGCPDEPRLYCEEFECEGASCAEITTHPGSVSLQQVEEVAEAKEVEADVDKLMGLCINCENRRSCKYPRPNGGVWYCEEYR